MPRFMDMLQDKFDEGKSVCVGLDVDLHKIPACITSNTISGRIIAFNQAIVDATKDIVCAYKPNSAFYEAHGVLGLQALELTVKHIRRVAPDVPIILDYKRGDIGNTNLGYTAAAFDPIYPLADAVTINPYMGREANQPFLDMADKGIVALCRTSNPGAGEFQDLPVAITHDQSDELGLSDDTDWELGKTFATTAPVFVIVARNVSHDWNANGNCCLVVGATAPAELAQVRAIVGDMPILIPGIGAQGGDLEATVAAGKNSRGQGMIINGSRGIIYASSGDDFAAAARQATLDMHNAIAAAVAA